MPEGFRAILPVTPYVVSMGLAFCAAGVGTSLSALQALLMCGATLLRWALAA